MTELWRERPALSILLWLTLCATLASVAFFCPIQTQIPGPASREALLAFPAEQIGFAKGVPPTDTVLLVLRSSTLRVGEKSFDAGKERLVEKLREFRSEDGAFVFGAVRTIGHNEGGDEMFESADGHAYLLIATTKVSLDRAAEAFSGISTLFDSFRAEFPEFELKYVSDGTMANEIFSLIDRDLDRSLFYTLPLSLGILYWAFGSFYAACLPLGVALVSLAASLGAAAAVSRLLGPVNATASQLVVLLVLALGVDYSLFILARTREERRRGLSHEEAVIKARKTTGRTVLWSAATVALSLFGLFLMNDSVLRSMAVVSIIAVVFTALGSVGVIPSILLLNPRFSESSPRSLKISSGKRWLLISLRHPLLVFLLIGGLMGAVSAYALQMRLGSTIDPRLLPVTLESNGGRLAVERNFPDVLGTDFSLVIEGAQLGSIEFEDKFQSVLDELHEDEHVRGPIAVTRNPTETATRYAFLATGDSNGAAARNLITNIRQNILPKLEALTGTRGYLSGRLPYIIDDAERYRSRSPVVFFAVLSLSGCLLLLAFRSIVVPIKAILLNLLSTCTAFGVIVYIFQVSSVVPWHYEIVEGFVPALLFSILFGLSMDYHLLLLGRIREEYAHGKQMSEAIADGISSASGAITSAALIMVAVFGVIACLELPVMKELGVGLSVAVALDATLVRSMLLPASMKLLGKANWYLPRWLSWIPDMRVAELDGEL